MKKIISAICAAAILIGILATCTLSAFAATPQRWFADKESVTDYAYSFCFVPDTQYITERDPSNLKCIYDWIVANAEAKKMKFVFGLGDITNSDTDTEWSLAKKEIAKLDGVVPYSLIRGNHDSAAKMNAAFANNKTYTDQFEGFFKKGSVTDSWRTLEAGGVKYLLITLDFGASDYALKWAENIIKQHPDHLVIITTHGYLDDNTTNDGNGTGTECVYLDANNKYAPSRYGFSNNGDDMWNELVKKYDNIFMVVCGHMGCEN
ncbi:MAG: metallophosphoesterase, partial [Clostridia bacterium]|nr:metallophosphoesterase [Clostridia bacterium]